jgi:RNA polymerase sigma-70 factor (ECF subfamily)
MPEPFVDSAEAEYMARWERTGRMQRIAELDERDRRLLLGFALEGKSTRELARENGMTDDQVRIRLHRIRKRLKKEEGDAE